MRVFKAAGTAVAFSSMLAACSANPHAAGPGALPPVPEAAAASSSLTTGARFDVHVVNATTASATKLTFEADGRAGTKQTLELHGCGLKNCSVTMPLEGGTHRIAIDGYSGHARVSQDEVFLNLVDCRIDVVSLALDQKPVKFSVIPESDDVTGSMKHGFSSDFGSGEFNVGALDAAGETVIGLAKDSLKAHDSSSKIALSQPAPDTLVLKLAHSTPEDTRERTVVSLTNGHANAHFAFTTEFSTQPTPSPTPKPAPCGSGSPSPSPSPSPSSSATSSPSPSSSPSTGPSPSSSPSTAPPSPTPSPAAVFVAYSTSTGGKIVAYDERGNMRTVSGGWSGAGNPQDLIWVQDIVWFYLTSASGSIEVYGGSGNSLPFSFTGVTNATSIVEGIPMNHKTMYVVGKYGSTKTIEAYIEDAGGPEATIGGTTVSFPSGITTQAGGLAYDSSNQHLYVANTTSNAIEEYDGFGNAQTLGGSAFAPPAGYAGYPPVAVAYASSGSGGGIYVAFNNGTAGTIAEYDANGSPVSLSGSFSGLVSPTSIVYDPHDTYLYVTDGTSVKVYDSQGNASPQGITFSTPSGVTSANSVAIQPVSGTFVRRRR